MNALEDRIAQAIADPGAVVGRKLGPSWGAGNDGYAEDEETVPRWSTRAVMAVLTAAGPDGCPGGYDLTPPAYRYTVRHTEQSNCDHSPEVAQLTERMLSTRRGTPL